MLAGALVVVTLAGCEPGLAAGCGNPVDILWVCCGSGECLLKAGFDLVPTVPGLRSSAADRLDFDGRGSPCAALAQSAERLTRNEKV